MDIILAKEGDTPGIMRLYQQFNEERIKSGVGDSNYKYLDSEMPWAKTLHEEDCITLIMKQKNYILAFITLRLSTFNPFKNVEKLAEVDLIVVDIKLRNKGLGTQLFKRARLYLKTYAVTHLLINVSKTNQYAMRFWKKLKFKTLSQTSFERSDGVQEETVYMVKKV